MQKEGNTSKKSVEIAGNRIESLQQTGLVTKEGRLMVFSNSSSKEDKSCCPIKQARRLYEKTFIVIHEDLVRQLHIDENTWFEQVPDENGIFLRIRR
jgi:hypothetical protein